MIERRGRRGLAWDLIPEQPKVPIYSTVAYFSLLNGQTLPQEGGLNGDHGNWVPSFWGIRVLPGTGRSFYPEQKDGLKNNRFFSSKKKKIQQKPST